MLVKYVSVAHFQDQKHAKRIILVSQFVTLLLTNIHSFYEPSLLGAGCFFWLVTSVSGDLMPI